MSTRKEIRTEKLWDQLQAAREAHRALREALDEIAQAILDLDKS